MKNLSILFIALCLTFILASCSGKSKDEDGTLSEVVGKSSKTAEQLYAEANDAMARGDYQTAIPLFEKIEQEYPYSKFATKSQLKAALAAFENDKYDLAILALDRFIELHPGNEEIDYAYYLKALAYYEQISDVSRDQAITQRSLNAFDTLLKRFPDSQYARDAKLKRDLTLDHLAGKEMTIGRYYLKRNQINAAINRFQTVTQKYETTTHVTEALHRLVESYLILGLRQEAVKVASVLGHNYPGSKWYQDTYKILDEKSRSEMLEERSFWNKTVDSLFESE
jgi:outer membrane protein assembly factor BamD